MLKPADALQLECDAPVATPQDRSSRGASSTHFASVIASLCLPALSGATLSLAWLFAGFEWVAWLALVPFAIAAHRPGRSTEVYLGSYLGGMVFALASLDWMRTADDSTGLSGDRAETWMLVGHAVGIVWLAMMFVARRLVLGRRLPAAVWLPLVWVCGDFAQSHLLKLIDQTGHRWLHLGLSQGDVINLTQIADLGGVFMVTALVAMVNAACYELLHSLQPNQDHRPRRPMVFAAISGILACGAAFGYGVWRLSDPPGEAGPAVCLMPENTQWLLPPELSVEGGDRLLARQESSRRTSSGRAGSHPRVDLYVWPEMAYPDVVNLPATDPLVQQAMVDSRDSAGRQLPDSQTATLARLEHYCQQIQSPLVAGCARRQEEAGGPRKRFNSAIYIRPDSGYVGHYDKVFLVPWNEFVPWQDVELFGRRAHSVYSRGQQYPVFALDEKSSGGQWRFATAICYDVCFPELFRRFMRPDSEPKPPDFFVIPGSESLDATGRLQMAMLRMARFRAIECRRAIVRNATDGCSAVIDANGAVLSRRPDAQARRPFDAGRIPIDHRESPYVRWGDWFPVTACCALVGLLLMRAGSRLPAGRRRIRERTGAFTAAPAG